MNLHRLLDSAKSLKISLIVVGVLSIAFFIFSPHVGIFAVPTLVYMWRSIHGRPHSNPPTTGEPQWTVPNYRN
jgi:hypothetical protein